MNQVRAESAIRSSARVERLLTVSNAEDRSRRMKTGGCRCHFPGFLTGMKEEIQVCSFRCQLGLGWVCLGMALM